MSDERAKAKPETPSPGAGPAENNPSEKDRGRAREIGGPKGPEPTRYGDWERAGRCIDF
jgi:hypothetical protein